MSNFTGFTDADIKQVQNGHEQPINNKSENDSQNKRIHLEKQKKNSKTNASVKNHKILNDKMKAMQTTVIPQEAKLCESQAVNQEMKKFENMTNGEIAQNETDATKCKVDDSIKQCNAINSNTNITDTIKSEKKFIDLEEFQTKQKLMEEQNRKRKEILSKALEDRTKRTQEEQQRLNKIQYEFKKLDANLSNDVKILRKQIEMASFDYMEAQKKYDKIEKEFLDAKLYLHNKLERKEMLTEYLCAIIEKNEERKAEKLNELIQKLDLTDVANIEGIESSVHPSQ